MTATRSIAVIVPTFNNATALRGCLDSVLAQTQSPEQIIVVDDASTDHSRDVLQSYGSAITLVARSDNGGAGAARNTGLERVTTGYVAFLDADDYWKPVFLERTLAFLDSRPECVAVSTAGRVRRGRGAAITVPAEPWPVTEPTVLDEFFAFWAAHDHVRTGTVLMRHDAVEAAGRQRAELRTSQDLEFWGCLALQGPWGFIPEVLWIGNSFAAARRTGWSTRHRMRRQTCPTVSDWEARLRGRVPPAQQAAFEQVRGRVAAAYMYMMVAGGNYDGARQTLCDYRAQMPVNRVVRLLRTGDQGGAAAWWLITRLLRMREHAKQWRRA